MSECIMIGYQSRVGKDTLANILEQLIRDNGKTCHLVTMSKPLYEITASVQLALGATKVEKRPELMQELADVVKKSYGSDIFARVAFAPYLRGVKIPDYVIVTDFRFKSEYGTACLAFGKPTTVRVARADRTIDRPQTHVSETELADWPFDYTVDNDSDLDSLAAKATALYQTIIQSALLAHQQVPQL
jgi:hypothetical protein